ncbi:hypothetical protein OJ997_23065 [Solirubrobacter phytolaccae]|uniref:Uncharacterized protein n=1 Tax=Solirubrobacter phytolaccae TaxID=1404360 RepID=A0A9X3NE05_9ACTN|nr:hypothetical protein [Solirubrobacter phytolaccae]MDA0183210.1 hypothetical protein [Solirubrobacter phytolaccae]
MTLLIAVVTETLLRRALAALPPTLRARYEEEWRADLAALTGRRLAVLSWALGLRRASRQLSRQAGAPRRLSRAALPSLAFDTLTLGGAYYAAFTLRFGGNVPVAYWSLFERTLPAVIVAGVVSLAIVGAYTAGRGGLLSVGKGVGLATLLVVAYVTVVQPILITSQQGLVPLNVPAGVCLLFAAGAFSLMACTRAGVAVVRVARS